MKYFFSLLLLFSLSAFAQVPTLSPNAKVSLLTISPGQELYSTFGHSAIRISDPVNLVDQNYNYGAFDFNSPGFYVKFMRGYLNYMISSYNSYIEMEYWNRENRLITEQVLNLTSTQKQKLFEYLENNLRPENRTYRYKFFTDNCSTRLRDVLLVATSDSLQFDKSFNTDASYRQWISRYAEKNQLYWANFGMNIAIGVESDQATGWSNAMFIPDNLMKALDLAQINTKQGKEKFVLEKYNLNQTRPVTQETRLTPGVFFMLLMLTISFFTGYQYNKKSTSTSFDKFFFSIVGLAGWIFFALWFLTDHGVTRYNLSLLWASPLVFPAVLFLGKNVWASFCFLAYAVILAVGYALFLVQGYKFPAEVTFIVLSIIIRLVFLFKQKQFGLRKN